jgi:hypothetical protein
LAVTNSAIVGNSATASVPPPCTVCGVAGDGGGIYNESGIASLTNTTVSANSSASGAIANNAQMTIKNSTIANNFASSPRIGPGGTAGVVNGGTLILQNSIIAQNNSTGFSHDFAGTPTSLGNNLIGSQGTSTGWIESDKVNVDPRIGPLEDNGGPTLTHALLPDSPAIDAGNNVGAPTTDQRGNRRPRDGNGDGVAIVDIGAFEFALGQAGIEAVADAATVNEDTTANVIDVLANDTGPAGSTLIVNAVTQPAHGSATIGQGGNNVVYVPGPNYVGSDSFAYTVSDGTNAATATVNITVVNTDTDLQGSTAGDVFFVRRNPAGTNVEVFDSEEATGIPLLSMPMTSASLLLIESLAGDDRLIIDLAYGNPIPTGGVRFAGGEHVTAGDQLLVRDAGVANGTYLADATTAGSGTVTIGGRNLTFFDVESIDVSRLNSLTVVTPNADDMLSLTNPAAGIGRLTGKSGGVALATLDFSDIANIIIDAAGHDGTAGDDSLDISTVSNLPGNFGFLQYRSGSGENTLAVQSGVVRADATVSPGGVLNTTVASGSHMVTHRFRQSSVTLDENARATILPDGTDAATSVVNDLTINAGATLDLNDNALIVNYTGTSALETIRVKIIEGRGGTGIGNGKWNGTGITSGVAQQQSVIQPDTWSVGYAENSALPLGAYSNFRGQPIDATSILIAYTKTGDVNLDGLVNDDDVTIVSATYAPNIAEPDWALGDLDYNGFVDDDDVTLLGALYQPPSPSDLSPPPASTPSSAPSHSTAVHNEFFAAFDTRYAQVRAAKRRLFCTDFDAFQVT